MKTIRARQKCRAFTFFQHVRRAGAARAFTYFTVRSVTESGGLLLIDRLPWHCAKQRESKMNKIAMDALNKGWSLGFATGKVRVVHDSDFDQPLEEQTAPKTPASGQAILASQARPNHLSRLAELFLIATRRHAIR